MTLNKTGIEWCDKTWNPVTGCLHNCDYCYARKIATRFSGCKSWPNGFEPMFHNERLVDPSKEKKPQSIFVCSMADLFGEWVPDFWHKQIFNECVVGYNHTYLFLTKNPKRYLTIPATYLKGNKWFGTTITNAFDAGQRLHWLKRLESNTFVSFEPLLGDVGNIDLTGVRQVIIGAQTNPTRTPRFDWIMNIQKAADRAGAKVFCKDSLSYLNVGETNNYFRRELCWGLHK